MRVVIFLLALVAFAFAAAIGVSGPGARLELWDYSTGLKIMRTAAQPIPVLETVSLSPVFTAAGLALLGAVVAGFLRRWGLAVFAAVATVAAVGAGMAPLKMRELAQKNPFIHDITTDFEQPPEISAAAGLPRKNPPVYVGAEMVRDSEMTVAEAQRTAFPDIRPLTVTQDLETTAAAAHATLDDMKLETIAEGPASDQSGAGWRIEAVATSFWYGFKDDFIVRLTSAGEDGTRIDVRSKSRVGGSDLGANAARVRDFLLRMDAAL